MIDIWFTSFSRPLKKRRGKKEIRIYTWQSTLGKDQTLDAGGKPSTIFPLEKVIKIQANPETPFKIASRYLHGAKQLS